MGLESATYVSDLSSSDPAGSDNQAQGDDHLRLIKAVLKATFPNADKPLYFPKSVAAKTGNYTVLEADWAKVIPVSSAAANRTITMPANVPDGFEVTIVKADNSANTVTLTGVGSGNINGQVTQTLHQRYQKARLIWSDATSEWFAEIEEIEPVATVKPYHGSAAPVNYLFANGETIGKVGSGADHESAAYEALYVTLWNAHADTELPVTGGRGASGSADFHAGKALALPNYAGRVGVGNGVMGGITDVALITAAGAAGFDGAVLGKTGGDQGNVLVQANLPNVNLTGSTATDGAHTHDTTSGGNSVSVNFGPDANVAGLSDANNGAKSAGSSHSHSITLSLGGSDTPHNNVQPSIVCNVIIRY